MTDVVAVPGLGMVMAMNGAHLTEADAYWSCTADVLETSFGEVSRGLANPGGTGWEGEAADHAQARGRSDLLKVKAVAMHMHEAAAIARRGASQLEASRQQVLDAVEAARGDDFDVSDDYTVTDLWTGGSEDFQASRHALAEEHASYIWHKVTALAAADKQIAGEIATATEGFGALSFDELPADTPPDDSGEPKDPLAEILAKYQVSEDPDGMVDWEPPWPASLFTDPKNITAGEAKMLDDLGILGQRDRDQIKDGSREMANSRFPPPGGREIDNHNDAFRHAYWNALMTQRFGEWTRKFATAHERLPDNYTSSEAMDLYNNEVGREIAVANPHASPARLADLVEQAVRNGDTVVIRPDGQGVVWSNQIPVGAPTGDSSVSAPVGGNAPVPAPAGPRGGYDPGLPGGYGTTAGGYG